MEPSPPEQPKDTEGDSGTPEEPEEHFPPTEKKILDDDFLNTYGRDPEERI